MRPNDSSQNDNAHETDEESTLDVALHCGECGLPLTLTFETMIGLGGKDMRTPVPLCSVECVQANVQRIIAIWDRCSCGAVVDSRDHLKTSAQKGIVGCRACNFSGKRVDDSGVLHFWATSGAALCVPPGQPSHGKVTTIRRSQVNCAGCLHALMVETEVRAKGSRRRS